MRTSLAPVCRGFALVGVVTLCGCNEPQPTSPEDANIAVAGNVVMTAPTPSLHVDPSPVPLTATQTANVCKAGVATLMGRDPKTMKAKPLPDQLTRIEYRRSSDRKLWKFDCRIDGNKVIMRGFDQFGNDGPGRWRDGPDDETITFVVDGDTVTVHDDYGDGSSDDRTYRF